MFDSNYQQGKKQTDNTENLLKILPEKSFFRSHDVSVIMLTVIINPKQ